MPDYPKRPRLEWDEGGSPLDELELKHMAYEELNGVNDHQPTAKEIDSKVEEIRQRLEQEALELCVKALIEIQSTVDSTLLDLGETS